MGVLKTASGVKAKSADILGADEEEIAPVLDGDNDEQRSNSGKQPPEAVAREAAKGLPSPHKTDLRDKLRDRVQLNFPRVPRFIRDDFKDAAKKAKMKEVEFLYYCLREGGGLNIPPYDQMDLRKT